MFSSGCQLVNIKQSLFEKPLDQCSHFFKGLFQGKRSDLEEVFDVLRSTHQSSIDNIKKVSLFLQKAVSTQRSRLSTDNLDALAGCLFQENAKAASLSKIAGVNSYIAQLSKITSKGSHLHHRIEALQEKLSIAKKWTDLGLNVDLIDSDYDSVRFLVKERLIYTIVGLQNSSEAGRLTEHLQVRDGKLFIRKMGEHVPVSSLVGRLAYNEDSLQCLDKETGLAWNYFLQDGLVQADRCTSPSLVPITHLSKEEHSQLLAHAQQFEELSFEKETPPTCIFQIVTNPKQLFPHPNWFAFDGLKAQCPNHVYCRIIDQNGDVYSIGFSKTAEENAYWKGSRSHLVTINGAPSIIDWEEFQRHKGRRVTSLPMTQETCDQMLAEVKKMRQLGVRFNLATDNCSNITSRLSEIAGVTIHHEVSTASYLFGLIPSLFSLSPLRKLADRIISISHTISRRTMLPSLEEIYSFTVKAASSLFMPVQIVSSIALNVFLMIFGAHRGSPPKPFMYGDLPEHHYRKRTTILSTPWSFLSAPRIADSAHIIEWQDAQKSTSYYDYKGPALNVLPQGGKEVPTSEKRAFSPCHFERERRKRLQELAEQRGQFFHSIFVSFSKGFSFIIGKQSKTQAAG
jgi:hypothetical protein